MSIHLKVALAMLYSAASCVRRTSINLLHRNGPKNLEKMILPVFLLACRYPSSAAAHIPCSLQPSCSYRSLAETAVKHGQYAPTHLITSYTSLLTMYFRLLQTHPLIAPLTGLEPA